MLSSNYDGSSKREWFWAVHEWFWLCHISRVVSILPAGSRDESPSSEEEIIQKHADISDIRKVLP